MAQASIRGRLGPLNVRTSGWVVSGAAPNTALLTDAYLALRAAFGAANRER